VEGQPHRAPQCTTPHHGANAVQRRPPKWHPGSPSPNSCQQHVSAQRKTEHKPRQKRCSTNRGPPGSHDPKRVSPACLPRALSCPALFAGKMVPGWRLGRLCLFLVQSIAVRNAPPDRVRSTSNRYSSSMHEMSSPSTAAQTQHVCIGYRQVCVAFTPASQPRPRGRPFSGLFRQLVGDRRFVHVWFLRFIPEGPGLRSGRSLPASESCGRKIIVPLTALRALVALVSMPFLHRVFLPRCLPCLDVNRRQVFFSLLPFR
jgi:hypothetical protein